MLLLRLIESSRQDRKKILLRLLKNECSKAHFHQLHPQGEADQDVKHLFDCLLVCLFLT